MRRALIFLLSLGVILGYGGAIASARWHAGHGGCEHSRFDDRFHHPGFDRFGDDRFDRERQAQPQPQQAAVPQTVVVQPAAAAAAPAPQIFVIMPGATAPQAVPTQIVVPQVTQPLSQAAAVH